jgi:hypothetical protein
VKKHGESAALTPEFLLCEPKTPIGKASLAAASTDPAREAYKRALTIFGVTTDQINVITHAAEAERRELDQRPNVGFD